MMLLLGGLAVAAIGGGVYYYSKHKGGTTPVLPPVPSGPGTTTITVAPGNQSVAMPANNKLVVNLPPGSSWDSPGAVQVPVTSGMPGADTAVDGTNAPATWTHPPMVSGNAQLDWVDSNGGKQVTQLTVTAQ